MYTGVFHKGHICHTYLTSEVGISSLGKTSVTRDPNTYSYLKSITMVARKEPEATDEAHIRLKNMESSFLLYSQRHIVHIFTIHIYWYSLFKVR